MVVAVNKWDAIDEYQRELVKRSLETRLAFLKFAALHLISARKRQGLAPALGFHLAGIPCGELQDAHAHFDPLVDGGCAVSDSQEGWCPSSKASLCPPRWHEPAGHRRAWQLLEHVTEAYKRFLEGRFLQGVQPDRHTFAHPDEVGRESLR